MNPDSSLRLQPSRSHAPDTNSASVPIAATPGATGPVSPESTAIFAGGPRTGFVYDGRLGELYGIFLTNLLWTILTLTVFRFWGKTRMRRYLWSRTSLNGDRFEYTGTGGEMFIGFLIVMPFYLLFIFGSQAAYYGLDIEPAVLAITQIIGAFFILYLVFVAQYAAQRYRLTRTLWRGIRGGMTGSPWTWGFKALFFAFLSLLTLTLAGPWTQMRLLGDRINNSYFGDAKAEADLTSRPLYLPYILGGIGATVASLVLVGIASLVMDIVLQRLGLTEIDPAEAQTHPQFLLVTFVSGIIIYLGMVLIFVVAFAFYQTALAREIARKLRLGGLRFATPVTPTRIMSRYLGNILIIVFTLGLGLPIAIHRTMLFLAANIEVIGEIEGSEVTHANLARPRAGEGLLEAFDPGFL